MKFLIISIYLFFGILLLNNSNIYAQSIDATLDSYFSNNKPERVHLHFDRTTYSQGDTIWFKAYIMAGSTPTNSSKNLYVDWADHDGNILVHQMYPIGNTGTSRGQLQLPDNYSSSTLQVHAYTRWMLQDDSNLLYHKIIPILQNKNENKVNLNGIKPSLYFFPEGGESVIGLFNKIAFQAMDQWGRPVKIVGDIQNNNGEKLAEIKSLHDGMGFIKMIPNMNETYFAKWKDEQGLEHQTELPTAKVSGIVLNVFEQKEAKYFNIQRSENSGENLKKIYIVATMHGSPVYMATVNLKNTTTVSSYIPLAGLSAGGLVVTLFDADLKPIAERVCFVHQFTASVFETNINFDKPNFTKLGLNEFQITIPDSIPTNLSISITDGTLTNINQDNIVSRLLLTGDIRGNVFNPAYYISDTTKLIQENLDLVMLTHGWRRFNWGNIMQGKMPNLGLFRDSSFYTLSGKVSGISESKLKKAGDLFLILTNKYLKVQNHFVPMNQDGSFSKSNLLLFDSTKLFYKFSNKVGIEEQVKFELKNIPKIEQPIFKDLKKESILFPPTFYTTDSTADDYFKESLAKYRDNELPPVIVTVKQKSQKEKLDDQYVNNELFKGNLAMRNTSFDITNEKNRNAFANIFGFLQARVAGIRITGDLTTPTGASAGDGGIILSGDANVALFIDEAPADIPSVGSLSMNEVAYLKVFYAPFVGAPLNGSAIVIYTKKGNETDSELSLKMPFINVNGYTALKEFYLPNYEGIDASNNFKDMRKTIYWNPMLITSTQNNSVKIKFYNNSLSTSFRLVIEGINQLGEITHLDKIIK